MLEDLNKKSELRSIVRPVGVIEFHLDNKPSDVYIPLLLSNRRDEYELPGGEGAGSTTEDLVREIFEETGLQFKLDDLQSLPLTIDERQISGRHHVKGSKGIIEIVSKPFIIKAKPVNTLPGLNLSKQEHKKYIFILFHLGETEAEIRINAQIRNNQIGGFALYEGRSGNELCVVKREEKVFENVPLGTPESQTINISDVTVSVLSRYFKYKFDNE